MSDWQYDVLGLGNAIVDVIARAEDDFLRRENLNKGGMMLIDEARAHGKILGLGRGIFFYIRCHARGRPMHPT